MQQKDYKILIKAFHRHHSLNYINGEL